MGRTKGIKNNKKLHTWTNEEKIYLSEITPGNHYKDILKMMNEKFEYEFILQQVTSAIKRYGLKTGFDCRYKKGNIPFNKGTKGLMNPNKTSFKPGSIPANHRPVGSERINIEGYIEIKVAEPNKWRLKHRFLYERHKGEIPKNHVVIFADGDKTNLDIDNLLLVSRSQLMVLNKNNLIYKDKELTKTGINIANVMIKLSEVKNKKQGGENEIKRRCSI